MIYHEYLLFMSLRNLLPSSLCVAALFCSPLSAQDSEINELKAALKAMHDMVQQQNARIAALEQQISQTKSVPVASSAPESAIVPSVEADISRTVSVAAMDMPVGILPPSAIPQGQSLVRDMDAFVDQQQAAPRANNIPLDPTMSGFVPIPGTESIFKIGGSARIDAITDFGNSGNPNQFVPSSIPLPRENGAFDGARNALHTKATRLSLELRRPVSEGETLRIYSEYDFFDDSASTAMRFRARHFYGQVWNILIGQTFSAFMDADAWPDVVDYEGPNGILNRRVPQIRYTHPFSDGLVKTMVFVSMEQADARLDLDSVDAPPGAAIVNRTPDGVLGFRVEGEAGHVQATGLGRELSYHSDGGQSADTFGWGASVSGALNMADKDKLTLQFTYGEGVARYINDLSGLNLDAVYDNGKLKAVPVFATMAGYTHHWSDQWRTTVSGGYLQADAPAAAGGLSVDSTLYSSVNLMWHPTKSFRMGLEYLYGFKDTLDGSNQDAYRLNFVLRYDLVR